MLAPIDKIKNGGNDIIQIVVTTACNLFNCSNCTQLLPFRKDYLHMDPDVFRSACHSLRDWPGVVAMFGGNPCSHPNFPLLCQIMKEEIPTQRHRGLWSNDLMGHGQIVHETFFPYGRFNINAHTIQSAIPDIDKYLPGQLIETSRGQQAWHSSVLVHWRDMGLTYRDWVIKRESCDVNRNWSAAVVERDGLAYAYFCEVAAALDGMRNQNSGMLIHDGWWRDSISSYYGQVGQCCDRGCGIPLRMKGNLDLSNTYDVSPTMLPYTEDRRGKVNLSTINAPGLMGKTKETTDYMRLRGGK